MLRKLTAFSPQTFEDAIASLIGNLTDAERAVIKDADPVEFHHGVGRDIRNSWKLWDQSSVLTQHFQSRFGLNHADDISGLILFGLKETLMGREVDPTQEVARYLAHWAKS